MTEAGPVRTESVGTRNVTRAEVEDFLYREAALLDAWRLDDWLALFEDGATHEIPTTDWHGESPAVAQYFVADDWDLLRARVKRLKSRKAHAENPRSRTHRLVGNVRLAGTGPDWVSVQASFVIHRIRDGVVDSYLGNYDHILAVPGGLRFRRRRTVLAFEEMRPGGRLSFIV